MRRIYISCCRCGIPRRFQLTKKKSSRQHVMGWQLNMHLELSALKQTCIFSISAGAFRLLCLIVTRGFYISSSGVLESTVTSAISRLKYKHISNTPLWHPDPPIKILINTHVSKCQETAGKVSPPGEKQQQLVQTPHHKSCCEGGWNCDGQAWRRREASAAGLHSWRRFY